jgi:hypothetical protein
MSPSHHGLAHSARAEPRKEIAMTPKHENTRLANAVRQVGLRAVKAVERAAGDLPWTEDAILRAAGWLETGAKEGGLARAWPNLAARLRNLVDSEAPAPKKHESADEPSKARATTPKAKRSARAQAASADATPHDPAALPFLEFCEKYLRHLEKEGRSRGTVFSYSLDLNVAARHFGETRDVKSITVEDVAAYFESDAVTKNRGGGAKNPITVSKLRRTLRMALEWGAKVGLLGTAPVPASEKAKADVSDEVMPTAPSAT